MGFTLIEMMMVVAIVGILAAIAIPQIQRFADTSKRAEGFLYAKLIHAVQFAHFSDQDTFVVGPWEIVHLALGISTELTRDNKFYTQVESVYGGLCASGTPAPCASPTEAVIGFRTFVLGDISMDLPTAPPHHRLDILLIHHNYPDPVFEAVNGVPFLAFDDIHNRFHYR